MIVHAMRGIQNIYPGKRVRAVDGDGRMVDLLIG
jgi:hypothetical protein